MQLAVSTIVTAVVSCASDHVVEQIYRDEETMDEVYVKSPTTVETGTATGGWIEGADPVTK